MANVAEKYIRIPKEEYTKLKALQKRFEAFWVYLKHLKDIDDARKNIAAGKIVSQKKLFQELGI
ncbi:MAG: hypothetical protein AAB527_03230 [Patescibacteria group bacterium]